MAYGLNPAGARREQQDALRGARKKDEQEDVVMVELDEDLVDDSADDIGGGDQEDNEQDAGGPQRDPVDYELLISVAHGLGKWMQDTTSGQKVYVKDPDCIGCLKDLQRFLRRDDPDTRPVFQRLGEWRIAVTDLVPLLVTYPHDKEITLQAVKVLTYLTMPVDPNTAKPGIQEGYVRDVKEAMTQPDALVAVLGLVAEPLAAHPHMSPEQQGAVQLVLALLRNLLAVPDEQPSPTLAAGSTRTRLQASLLSLLFSESIMELLLLVAQHGTQAPLRREMPILLEILYDTYRDITPQQLLAAKEPPPPRKPQKPQPQPQSQSQPQAHGHSKQQPPAPAGAAAPKPAAASRPSPAAFHPTGAAGAAASRPAAAAAPPGAGGAPGPPRPPSLDSAVTAQLRRQQLANAAKMRGNLGAPAMLSTRPDGAGGRFVISHADDPGHRKTFLARPSAGVAAATTIKQQIVEAPLKMVGAKPPGSSGSGTSLARRDAGLAWKLRCFADDLLASGYNQLMEVIRRDVAAGVGVGRLERPDLLRFMQLAAFFTKYCRLQQEARAAAQKANPTAAAGAAAAPVSASASAAGTAAAKDGAAEGAGGAGSSDPSAAAGPAGPPSPAPSPFSGISGTMGWDTFHLVCKLWVEQADISTKHRDWELQAVSMRLLCEMQAVLMVAHRHGTREDRAAADRLQRRLLHDDLQESGLLPVLSRLMTAFTPARQSRSYACDLIMSLHYVLRMYDRLTSLEPGGFLVRAKKRAGGRRRKRQPQQQEGDEGKGGDEGADADNAAGEGDGGGSGGKEDGGVSGAARKPGKAPLDELAEGSGEEDEDDDDEDEDEDGGGLRRSGMVERPLDLNSKVRGKLAQPAVIYFVTQLLACYKALPAEVPRAIASLLYRIAGPDHLDLEPMLYQISVLRVFYVLLSDPDLRSPAKLPAYREVLLLATRVVRNLFKRLVPERYPGKGGDKDKGKEKEEEQGPGEDAGGEDGAAAAGEEAEKRRQRRQELVAEIHDKAPRMLLVDMLFWKDHSAAAAINQDYWLWMALDDREREEAEYRRGGGDGGEARRRRRGRDAWGDDDGDRSEGGEGGNRADADRSGSGREGAPRTGGRLRRAEAQGRAGGGADGGGDEDEDGALADEDGPETGTRGPQSALRRRAARGVDEEEEDDDGGGGGRGAGAEPGPRSQGTLGTVLWSDDEQPARGREGGGSGNAGAAAGAGAAARKQLTLQEREEMLRKRFMKTVRVGNGRSKRSANAGGDEDGGGGGRGLRLSSAQQALLLQLFERNNSSRHNADIILEGMKRGGATGGLEGAAAEGEAAGAAGVEMSSGQLMRQLKKMGLRFKQLTEDQVSRLRYLYSRYRDDPDSVLMIAAQLPGGWTSKDVNRLMAKHGLTKAGRRGRRGSNSGSDSGSDGGSGSGSEDDPDVARLDEEELAVLWEEHGGQPDAVEKIAAALVTPASESAVGKKLRQMGLIKKQKQRRADKDGKSGGRRGRRGGAGEGGQVDVAALRRLYEEHRSRPDHLNVIAALLPGGKTVKQVQRLLRSHGLLDDDAARRKRARDAAERTRLVALYQQTRGSDDQLEAIARLMPELSGGAKQVAKLLRKHGLLEGPGRRSHRRSSDGEGDAGDGGEEGEGDKAARNGRRGVEAQGEEATAGPSGYRDRIREPDPDRILQALAGIHEAYEADGRWMDPRAAAAWIVRQLSAAENLWEMAGGATSDYCLVLTCDEDEDFFMTEYSQDLLEACGIRNASDDYYKIPAASTAVWRSRVREALQAALGGLGSERAAALAAQLRQRREEEEAERRREREARDAAEEEAARATALFAGASGRRPAEEGEEREGGGGGRGRGRGRGRGAAAAGAGGRGPGRRRGSTGEPRGRGTETGGRGRGRKAKHEDVEDEEGEDAGSSSGSGGSDDDRGAGGGRSAGQRAEQQRRAERRRQASPESGRRSDSSDRSSSGPESESDGEGRRDGEAVVLPNYDTSSASEAEREEGAGASERPQREGGSSGSRRKEGGGGRRKEDRAKGKADAAATARRRVKEALGGSSESDGEGGPTGRRRAVGGRDSKGPTGEKAARKGGKKAGAGPAAAAAGEDTDGGGPGEVVADADARRRALAEIARRRQEQARRMQDRVKGTLVPTAAPSAEELRDGSDGDDGDGGDDLDDRTAAVAAAGNRRRRSGDPLGVQAAAGGARVAKGGAEGDDEGDDSDSGAAGRGGGGKRRRLLRKAATAGLGSGKENVELPGAGVSASAASGKGVPAARTSDGPDEEMVELEDGLEDF